MKKKYILLILSSVIFFGFSVFQENEKLDPHLFYETLIEEDYLKIQQTKSELQKIEDILSQKELMDCPDAKTKSTQYFLKDLNVDGVDELIFNSACDPYPRFFIFSKNKNGEMAPIYNGGGKLKRMEIDEKDFILITDSEPCCCAYFGAISVISKINKFNAVSEVALYHINLLIPSSRFQISRENFMTTKSIVLKNYPSEQTPTTNHPCTGNPYKENFLLKLKEGAKGMELSKFGNWSFVILYPDYTIIENEFNQILENEAYIFGWMKNDDFQVEKT